MLVVLAAARYYAVLGPPSARILFPLHCLVMWALPFTFLTPLGRRQIGLRKPAKTVSNLAINALAGASSGFVVFILGMAIYGNSSDNWCVSIRDAFQFNQLRMLGRVNTI